LRHRQGSQFKPEKREKKKPPSEKKGKVDAAFQLWVCKRANGKGRGLFRMRMENKERRGEKGEKSSSAFI